MRMVRSFRASAIRASLGGLGFDEPGVEASKDGVEAGAVAGREVERGSRCGAAGADPPGALLAAAVPC